MKILVSIAIIIFLAICAIIAIKKQQNAHFVPNEQIAQKKENEIEKTSPDTLISTSNNSAAHYSRIEQHKQQYNTNANNAISDILRRNSGTNSTNSK